MARRRLVTHHIELRTSLLDNSDAPNDCSLPVSALFFKRFLKRPFQIASIVPSSKALVERVANKLDFSQRRVIAEYGPGEGVDSRESTRRFSSMVNQNISCQTSRRCSSLFFTRRHLRIAADDAPRSRKDCRDWLALEQTVPHDRKADAHRKRFDGRDVASGGCAAWRIHAPRGAQFSGEWLSVFATVYSRFRSDQGGSCPGES